jgi:hypothetical protein
MSRRELRWSRTRQKITSSVLALVVASAAPSCQRVRGGIANTRLQRRPNVAVAMAAKSPQALGSRTRSACPKQLPGIGPTGFREPNWQQKSHALPPTMHNTFFVSVCATRFGFVKFERGTVLRSHNCFENAADNASLAKRTHVLSKHRHSALATSQTIQGAEIVG